eukprot:1239441-Pyramimonas_sp.AAC.1
MRQVSGNVRLDTGAGEQGHPQSDPPNFLIIGDMLGKVTNFSNKSVSDVCPRKVVNRYVEDGPPHPSSLESDGSGRNQGKATAMFRPTASRTFSAAGMGDNSKPQQQLQFHTPSYLSSSPPTPPASSTSASRVPPPRTLARQATSAQASPALTSASSPPLGSGSVMGKATVSVSLPTHDSSFCDGRILDKVATTAIYTCTPSSHTSSPSSCAGAVPEGRAHRDHVSLRAPAVLNLHFAAAPVDGLTDDNEGPDIEAQSARTGSHSSSRTCVGHRTQQQAGGQTHSTRQTALWCQPRRSCVPLGSEQLGSWNVEGLRGDSRIKLTELFRMMNSIGLGILCIQETQLHGAYYEEELGFLICLSGELDAERLSNAGV